MDYGCIAYGSTRKSYLKALDPIHHQGLRIAFGAFRTSPKESLYAEAGEPSLQLRRLCLAMNYYLKLKANPSNPTYKCVFGSQLVQAFEKKPNEIRPFGIRMNEYFQAFDIDVDLVCDDPLETNVPSWKLSKPVINLSMTSLKKDTTPESVYRQRFFEQSVNYKHFDKIFTDGSLKGEKAAAAAVS